MPKFACMTADEFLSTLPKDMAMRTADWLEEQLRQSPQNLPVLLDLRDTEAWKKGHIRTSVAVRIQELPERVRDLIPSHDSTVVMICNGSIQSAMATMFLRMAGYPNCYNLSGGYSAWIRNDRPVEPAE